MAGHERSTYKAFAEIKAALSPAEERFERWRNTVGLFLGPAVALIIYLIPLPTISPKAHVLAAILGWICTWWVTEPIPIPISALVGSVLCVLFDVANARVAFAPFADPTIYLFLGSFILAEGMANHGLDKRFAYGIMSLRWVGNSTARLLLAYGAISAFISMWISNTATTAMMFIVPAAVAEEVSQGPEADQARTWISGTGSRFVRDWRISNPSSTGRSGLASTLLRRC
jgi:sodium-dependent dicarboxylate transporter 2/3/5